MIFTETVKKIALILVLSYSVVACDKTSDQIEPQIDFAYSTSYIQDSAYLEICVSNACNYLPEESEFRWYFNGSINNIPLDGANACDFYSKNGSFSVSLVVTTPDGIQYSKVKTFDVTGIKR